MRSCDAMVGTTSHWRSQIGGDLCWGRAEDFAMSNERWMVGTTLASAHHIGGDQLEHVKVRKELAISEVPIHADRSTSLLVVANGISPIQNKILVR